MRTRDPNFKPAKRAYNAQEYQTALEIFNQCKPTILIQLYQATCLWRLEQNHRALEILEPLYLKNLGPKLRDKTITNEYWESICSGLVKVNSFIYKETGNRKYLESIVDIVEKNPEFESTPFNLINVKHARRILGKNSCNSHRIEETIPDNSEYKIFLMHAEMKINGKKLTRAEAISLYEELKTHTLTHKTIPNISILYDISMAAEDIIDLETTPIIANKTQRDFKIPLIYENLNMANQAEEAFKIHIKNYVDDWETYCNYGYFLSNKLHDFREANNILIEVVEAKPNTTILMNAYRQMAYNYHQLMDKKNKEKYINLGLNLCPHDPSLKSILAKSKPTIKARKLYEENRVNYPERFNDKHPMPEPQKPKIEVYTKEDSVNSDGNSPLMNINLDSPESPPTLRKEQIKVPVLKETNKPKKKKTVKRKGLAFRNQNINDASLECKNDTSLEPKKLVSLETINQESLQSINQANLESIKRVVELSSPKKLDLLTNITKPHDSNANQILQQNTVSKDEQVQPLVIASLPINPTTSQAASKSSATWCGFFTKAAAVVVTTSCVAAYMLGNS
jgi:tetratricopeptide (TPR) repeat protein